MEDDWKDKYRLCRKCGNELAPWAFDRCLKDLSTQVCSTECSAAEIYEKHACCPKAERLPYVNGYHFVCIEHGPSHIKIPD